MTDLEMAAKFREAAEGIKKYGWAHGGTGDPARGRPRCASAALCHVGGGIVGGATMELHQLAQARIGGMIPTWNDVPERTKDDVIALFEGLAHDLELRHQIAATTSSLPAETGKTLATNRQLVGAVK